MSWHYVESYSGHAEFLPNAQLQENAEAIRDILIAQGWKMKPICAFIGFIQYESSLNPAQWQFSGVNPFPPRSGSELVGLGLPQYTPWYKLEDWIISKVGSQYYDRTMCYSGALQMEYFILTCTTSDYTLKSWYPTTEYPVTFSQYGQRDGESWEWLLYAYNACYGRGLIGDSIPTRKAYALHWWDLWGDVPPTPPTPPSPEYKPKAMSKILMYWNVSKGRIK